MLSACVILPFGPKACISAVALPRRLAKPWSPPVPKNPACDGLPMAWMRSWLCALPFSTSPMTRSGINLGHFWLLDCLQLFHTPREIEPALPCPHPGDIGHPLGIGRTRRELAVEQIGSDRMLVLAVGRSGAMPAWLRAQSLLAHESCHSLEPPQLLLLCGLMPTAGKGLLSLISQLLAPMIQGTVTDPQLPRNLAHRFATALHELDRLEFELLGVGLLLLWHTPLLR